MLTQKQKTETAELEASAEEKRRVSILPICIIFNVKVNTNDIVLLSSSD
jgi:hypothetical protein